MTLKSLLTVSLTGVMSVLVSNVALASNMPSTFSKPGFYAGIQGGRSDTFYSGRTFVSVPAPTQSTTVLLTPSLITTDTINDSEVSGPSRVDDVGISGRIYAGYQFNPYFAVETGYTQYTKTSFSVNTTVTHQFDRLVTSNDNPPIFFGNIIDKTTAVYHHSGEISENAIDLVGKATLPLIGGFGLYVKGGAAYINADRHTNLTVIAHNETISGGSKPDDTPPTGIKEMGSGITETHKSYQAFRPVAGVGVNYLIPDSNISLDVSYTRVFSSGAIPQVSFAALGLEYKFA